MQIKSIDITVTNGIVDASIQGTLPNYSYSVDGTKVQANGQVYDVQIVTSQKTGGMSAQALKRFQVPVRFGPVAAGKYALRVNGDNSTAKWFTV